MIYSKAIHYLINLGSESFISNEAIWRFSMVPHNMRLKSLAFTQVTESLVANKLLRTSLNRGI